ncbi:MBL fold metallo-hydrolase [Prevotella sp. SGI.027]
MLNIKCFEYNMLQENCYVVSDETKECIIIDCGAFHEKEHKAITQYIEAQGLKPVDFIATHGHIDHHFGDQFIHTTYGLKVKVHRADAFLMQLLQEQAEAFVGVKLSDDFPSVDQYLNVDDTISFGTHQFTLIETPGHTPGSVFFYCQEEHVAFSGDTLFHLSIGRTDLQGGSMFQMIQSLRTLSQLPDNTKIYPGHGEPTTIGTELAGNPYMDR